MIDAPVPHEIVGMLGFAVFRQVRRSRAGGEIQETYAPRDEVGFFDLPAPHRAIDPFFDEVGATLTARERQLYVGETGEKLWQRRHEYRAGHECWYVDA